MELKDAQDLAATLMQAHGVGHWSFTFDRATRRFGLTNYTTRTISLSAPLSVLNPEEQVADTILHEIGHVLAGPRAGHGPEWKAIMRTLGGRPIQYGNGVSPERRYTAYCDHCGKRYRRDRLPPRKRPNRYCSKPECYALSLPLRWVDNKARTA